MKKLILTVSAAALFCIGSIAQVQDSASNNLRQGEPIDSANQQMQQDADSTSQQMQQGADSTSQMDPASPSPNATDMGANAQPQMHEVEVLEDKEGPDNQVIYKYQGSFYYVDREQQQLVKIEESQLKDAEHAAIEHNAIMSGDEKEKNETETEQDKQ
jgi:hypothetical protein